MQDNSLLLDTLFDLSLPVAVEQFYVEPTLSKRRKVLRQLVSPPYSSKDAPRPPFSNAPRFISFGPLLMTLRTHLWIVAFTKNGQNMRQCDELINLNCYVHRVVGSPIFCRNKFRY